MFIPKQDKIIDLSIIVGKQIDVEFMNAKVGIWNLDPMLTKIDFSSSEPYFCSDEYLAYEKCRIRQDTWLSWQGGGECPLPEGLKIELRCRDNTINLKAHYTKQFWGNENEGDDIISFKVLGTAEGWKYA